MIEKYEEQLLNLIDERIANASDDELFAGGYLRGHISLAAAQCEEAELHTFTELKSRVEASLEQARAELTPADRIIVSELWQALQQSL